MNRLHLTAAAGALFFSWLYWPLDLPADLNPPASVYSAGHYLLWQQRSTTGAYTRALTLDDMPDSLVTAVTRAEDRWFSLHPGINPLSWLRMVYNAVLHRCGLKGSSTISMQAARLLYPMPSSAWLRKAEESLLALKLEAQLGKRRILEIYLNRAPMPANTAGFGEAAVRILGKPAALLTPFESAALAVLTRDNYPSPTEFYLRMHALLPLPGIEDGGSVVDGSIADGRAAFDARLKDFYARYLCKKCLPRPAAEKRAAHLVDYLQASGGQTGEITSTISSQATRDIERIINNELRVIEDRHVGNAAVVVLKKRDNRLVLHAMVGSRNYFDPLDGQVNGALSVRNAGSSLKPFLYAMAVDELGLKPYSRLADSPASFRTEHGQYHPKNYDMNYWFSVSFKESLANSRNVPAVELLEALGTARFYDLLRTAPLRHLDGYRPAHYGLGLALGSGGIRLLDLARLYSAFTTEGRLEPVTIAFQNSRPLTTGLSRRLFSKRAVQYISLALSDNEVRKRAFGSPNFLEFPFRAASKTGTSKDYRDGWTAGYTKDTVVAVWTGNFSAEPARRVSGVSAAGRIYHQVMRYMKPLQLPDYRQGLQAARICSRTARLARPGCQSLTYFVHKDDLPEKCSGHNNAGSELAVRSPAEGEVFMLDHSRPVSAQQIPLWVEGAGPLNWRFNRGPWQKARAGSEGLYTAAALPPGRHTLTVRRGSHERQVNFTIKQPE